MIAARCAHILIATLGLLALTTSASAECAWVLWGLPTGIYETTGGIGEDGRPKGRFVPAFRSVTMPDPWIEQAYDSRQDCQSVLAQAQPASQSGIEAEQDRRYKAFKLSDGTRIWVSTRFQCLPDTIDPRGPKGK